MRLADRLKGWSTGIKDNRLFQVLFENIGNGSVVWTDEDKKAYIDDLHNRNADLFSVIDYVVNGFNKIDFVVKNKAGEVKENGQLYDLLNKPNPSMGWDQLMSYYLKYKLITGDSYLFTPRVGGGRFIEIWPMPAQYMKIVSGGWMNPVKGYVVYNGTAMEKEFPAEDILHVKEVNLDADNGEQLYGMSRLQPGRYAVDTNTMAQEASAHRFKNRGASAIVTAKGATPEARPSKEALIDFKRQLKSQLSGTNKEGALVATMMDIDLHKLDISAVDLGIFEGQRMTLHQICNLYHVPPILRDPTTGNTYNNIKEAEKSYYKNAIIPEVQLFCLAFNSHISDAFGGDYIDYDTSNIESLQADYETMMSWLVNAPLTLNEKRKVLGFDELETPEANEVYIPASNVPLSFEVDNPGTDENQL